MIKISFPYRASSHLVMLHVISESGAWEKYGLDVNYNFQIAKKDAHAAMANGELEFIGGNHVSTYGRRARGDNWVYLGQTLNSISKKLVVRPESGINGVQDLYGKKVGTRGNHPGLDDWLFLKQRGLDADRDDLELIQARDTNSDGQEVRRTPLWQWVLDGRVDAALLNSPGSLFAEANGLKVIDLEPFPMIWFTTISSNLTFVERHPDVVDRFLRGLIEGIHFFKTEPEKSIKIIEDRYDRDGKLTHAQATVTYQDLASQLEPNLYPSMAAIANVYEEAKKQDPDARNVNPMALWDLHHVRQLDDEGFVARLYADGGRNDKDRQLERDPEFLKDKAEAAAKVISEVKSCGHLEGISCACE